ncbi:MAG: SufD family Fe-S cluster assembly protein [Sphingopyxis sp.]|uniref:SufD family Fe-S cluster assembly protein n=1 Tax=Sphingopyxis sp. TaxID=1908224 RepID=UPI002ABCF70F|nr:SufD family Fe-S cluster assembly protein [Sphingopyxis sp.]MDZ3833474.1 SufD family Fe-S cluster assembly protein [Sphingopyxis sp.]
MTAVPTRRDEAWRYSDIDAVADLWPIKTERFVVSENETHAMSFVLDATKSVARDVEIDLEPGAQLDLHVLNIAGAYGRLTLRAFLGEGARFHLGGVQIGGAGQTLEIVTTIHHEEPGAVSSQTIRSVVANNATGTYLGKVAVARDAQQTDSEQDVKAMLLDRRATANAKPELEIFADDVKCAHGCAIGELDAMSLYYLQSRGLPPAEAKKILLQAFVAGVFDGAEDEEKLQALALAKLGELV